MNEITNERLSAIVDHREEISAVLAQLATGESRARRKRYRALAQRFAQPMSTEGLLSQPDSLAVCLPLVDRASKGALEPWQIENAVRRGVDQLNRQTAQRQRVSGRLAYPALLLVICGLLLIGMAVFVVPAFERMFNDFGLTLPPVTAMVLQTSRIIQRRWLMLLVLAVIAALAIRLTMRREQNFLSALLTSTRSAWARWSWHVAMLIEAGVSTSEAIAIAGRASQKTWLKQGSAVWAQQVAQGRPALEGLTHVHGQSCQLLGYALRLPRAADQAVLLSEIAKVYRFRAQSKTAWWLSLMSPAAVCVVGTVIGLVISALFLPLIELIQGLT